MKKFLVLVLVAAIIGALNFVINPKRPAFGLEADEITVESALSFSGKCIIIDARPPKEFAESHLSGAINLPEENFDEHVGNFLDAWIPGQKIVIYCSSSSCNSSRSIANRLRDEFEIENIFILKGDWREWKQ